MQVIKRDGKVDGFDSNKISNSIATLVDPSNVEHITAEIINDVICENTITSQDLSNVVMKHLDKIAADKYAEKRFQRDAEREKNGYIFNRLRTLTNIDASQDTGMRENGNINADSTMGLMLKIGSDVMKHYYLSEVLSPEASKAHRDGVTHEHDLDFYGTAANCLQINLEKLFENGFTTGHGSIRTPQSIRNYWSLLCIVIQANQNDMFGGQSIPALEYYLAPGVSKSFARILADTIIESMGARDKYGMHHARRFRDAAMERIYPKCGKTLMSNEAIKELCSLCEEFYGVKPTKQQVNSAIIQVTDECMQGAEACIHNLCTMASRAGAQVPFSSVNYGMGTSVEQRMVIACMLQALDNGLGNGETQIFPIHVFQVKDGVNYKPGDPNYDLFRKAIAVTAHRMFPNYLFLDSPFNLQYYKEGEPDSFVATMGCVAGESVITYKLAGELFVEGIARLYSRFMELEDAQVKTQGRSEYFDIPDGLLEIYDSRTGGFVKVKRLLRNRDTDNWRKIVFTNGRMLVATGDHPLPVEGKGRTFVADLEIGDLVRAVWTQQVGRNQDVSEDLMWLLGAVLCDGGGMSQNSVDCYFGMDERDVVDNMSRIVAENKNAWGMRDTANVRDVHRGEKGDYYVVHIGGTECANTLSKLFGGGVKNERNVPAFVFNASYEARNAFLAGMVDADGYIAMRKMGKGRGLRVQIGSVNKELAYQQAALAASLGMPAKIYDNVYDETDSGDAKHRYKVEFGASHDLLMAMHCSKKKKYAYDKAKYPMYVDCPAVVGVASIEDLPDRSGEYSYDVETESDYFDVCGIVSHNCRTRVMGNVNGPETTSMRGNLSFITVNLPHLALESNGNIDTFFKKLDETIDLCIDELLFRFRIQASRHVYNYPMLFGNKMYMGSEDLKDDSTLFDAYKHGTLTTGFVGLAECLVALIGKHHGESAEAQELGLKIIGHMRDRMDQATEQHHLNFSLIGSPAESTASSLLRKDRERFGVIPGVTDKEYYTNSNHVPVSYNISAKDKIAIEAPYHALENGGHITYVEFPGDPTQNLEAMERIVRWMHDSNIGYGAINRAIDTCMVCGHTGIINDACPECGNKDEDKIQRLRRITGYLVGDRNKRFNDGKLAEERDRVKHHL